ncbi:MAG: NAD(P)-dependent oxidoreductase [Acidimicrobiia bacterium]|nr:NAD(P)-dependent oxidoreductase [Acidimicrobiia bacterium]
MDIGWIGLGDMGQVIVPRLLEAGHRVRGWNRTIGKAAPLTELGMEVADSAADAAAGADFVFSVVTDSNAVRAVALQAGGIIEGLSPEAIYMDMSTIDPLVSREVAAAFSERGLTMLDVPLSGSPVTVRQGKASTMVGGPADAFAEVAPILRDIGANVSHIGPQGTAVQMKVAINLTLIVEMVAFCESVALAEKGGVDRAVAVDAMLKSVVASPVMGYRGPFILDMPDVPLADVTLQQKDMVLALEVARRQGSMAPLGAVANELLNACRGLGIDHRDFVTVFDVYRMLAGVPE